MTKMRQMLVLVFTLLVVAAFGGVNTARAEELTCSGSLGAITVDNLRVPQGKTCTLNGTRVQGTIKVENNATLNAKAVRVVGNIQGENAKLVSVTARSTVGGSIQIVQGGAATINRVTVNGDILFDDNTRAIRAVNNTVGGNVQAFQNTGGVAISNNTIDGNLQCKSNHPAPTGGFNQVSGNKEDQCAKL